VSNQEPLVDADTEGPKGLVKLSDEQRQQIAVQIKDDIDAGIETQGGMSTWWLEAERAYLNQAPATQSQLGQGSEDPGYPVFSMPLTQTRVDMLGAQVATVVIKQNPVMTDTADDESVAEPRQKLMHRVWTDARFGSAVTKATNMCGVKDLAIYRFCPGTQPGTIRIDAIDPQDWSVFPAVPDGIQAAATVGHRTTRRRRVIEAMQKRGEYYPTEHLPESTQADHDDDQEQQHTQSELSVASPTRGNELIEIWDCVCRLDLDDTGDERLYRATLDYVGCQLLSLELYDFTYIWYFRSFYIGSSKYFYSGSSVARNLNPCQTGKNNLFSAFYGGVMSAAAPDVFGPPLDSGEKFTKVGMRDYVPTESGVAPFSPGGQFNGAPFPAMLALIEKDADMVARVSQNTQGAQATGQTTATEQSIIAAGVAVGLEMFIGNFTSEFAMAAAHTQEMIAADYDAFAARYGTEMPEEESQVPDIHSLLEGIGALNSGMGGELPPPGIPPAPPEFANQFGGGMPGGQELPVTGAPASVL
jgi:hypothetical protein